jgi:lipopolysaccharide export system protein LptA
VKNSTLSILFTFTFFLFSCSSSLSAEDAPIIIEADRMVSLEEDNSVLFTGNVDASQANIRIRSDKMTVYYTPPKDGKKQEVTRLKCVGNVEVTRDEWLGTGKEMNYLAKDRKVILSGDARAWQDKNLVTGDTIIYYLDEGRSEVVSDRTSATIGADSSKKKKPTRVKATLAP